MRHVEEFTNEILWAKKLDNKIQVEAANLPNSLLIKSNVDFYKACYYGPMTLQVNDCVLISNADSTDPDLLSDCFVARILYMYELQDTSDFRLCKSWEDRFRAIVKWYSIPSEVPRKFHNNEMITFDYDFEVIEDNQDYETDIDIKTIVQKCKVLEANPEDFPRDIVGKAGKTALKMFVCRYKIIKERGGSYKLVPVKAKLSVIDKRRNSKVSSRRSTVGHFEFLDLKENTVSPIKIVNNSVVKSRANETELNANYLTESSQISKGPKKRSNVVKRNLNLSLDKEFDEDPLAYYLDTPSYSIINDPNGSNNEMKFKFRLSETPKSAKKAKQDAITNTIRSNKEGVSKNFDDFNSIKGSTRKRSNNGYDDMERNLYAPLKKCNEDQVYQLTPKHNSDAKPLRRKSILKTPSSRSSMTGTPKRNILIDIHVQELVFDKNEAITPTKRRMTKSKRLKDFDDISEDESPKQKRNATLLTTPAKNNDKFINYLDYVCEERTPKQTNRIASSEKTPSKKGAYEERTPKQEKRRMESVKSPLKSNEKLDKSKSPLITSSLKIKLIRLDSITPTIDSRPSAGTDKKRQSLLQVAREQLHVSAVPTSLPCREEEFENIYSFIEGKIDDQCSGCMYVSGVPGTGKTATVTAVVRSLQKSAAEGKMSEFDFIEINGMRLTEPRQAYVQIYKQMTGKNLSWEQAYSLLDKRFTTLAPRRKTIVLLVDELDILCNRRQDVVYNLLDWPTKIPARLVVVTIANTMDLPERLLKGKVTSRLGLTRLTFQPYSFKQLQQIVTARLSGSNTFQSDAVQLVARKVAAVSGDARRALDICRRATEMAEENPVNFEPTSVPIVSMLHVQQALNEMITSPKVMAIRSCSKLQQIFLQAVEAEVSRTGVEETTFLAAYAQFETITTIMGYKVPVTGRALTICSILGSQRLLICEHSRMDLYQKILLNVSADDLHFALHAKLD